MMVICVAPGYRIRGRKPAVGSSDEALDLRNCWACALVEGLPGDTRERCNVGLTYVLLGKLLVKTGSIGLRSGGAMS